MSGYFGRGIDESTRCRSRARAPPRAPPASADRSASGGSDSPNQTTAGRKRAPHSAARRKLAQIGAQVVRFRALSRAAQAPQRPVQPHHAPAAAALVQTVHVLRDQQELGLAPAPAPPAPGAPGWAPPRPPGPPPGVETPHRQSGRRERLGGGQLGRVAPSHSRPGRERWPGRSRPTHRRRSGPGSAPPRRSSSKQGRGGSCSSATPDPRWQKCNRSISRSRPALRDLRAVSV